MSAQLLFMNICSDINAKYDAWNTNELENTYDEPKPNAYYKRKQFTIAE